MASVWTSWIWLQVHAVVVLAGVCAALVVVSATLAWRMHSLRRQQREIEQRNQAAIDTLLKDIGVLDDRVAILALAGTRFPSSDQQLQKDEQLNATAAVPNESQPEEALGLIRKEIERLARQLNEPNISVLELPGADPMPSPPASGSS